MPSGSRARSVVEAAALLAVLAAGLWARLVHIYKFFVYPDSYYYLLLADNLRRFGRMYGRLGPGGMRFPPIGSAIFKPVYPALVALVDFGLNRPELSGHVVAVGASLASIFLIYLLATRLLGSRSTGLISALLLAVSFNHIFWSGFIMGDSVSLFLLLAALLAVLRKDRAEYGNPLDFAAGAVFAWLFLSRATFVVVIPGLFWLMAAEFEWRRERWLTALSSGCAILALTSALILPPLGQLAPVAKEAAPIFLGALAMIALLALVFWAGKTRWFFPALLAAPVLAQAANFYMAAGSTNLFYPGLHRFVLNDPLICALGVPGLFLLYRSPKRRLSVFFALSTFLLLIVYYQAAAWEWRYLVQVLPFLVLPAAQAVVSLSTALHTRSRQRQIYMRVGAIFCLAVLLTAFGFTVDRALTPSSGLLQKVSYPAEVSRLARPALAGYPKNTVLIAALPWPYYYHLRFSTWGLDARQPEKVLAFLPTRGRFLIVGDLSLRLQFPAGADRLKAMKNARRVTSFSVDSDHQYAYFPAPRNHEVVIYELDYGQLVRFLDSSAGAL